MQASPEAPPRGGNLIVTLDGPAGSGKSTVARRLAERLGLEFLDTGAMYRGIAATALARGIDPDAEGHLLGELVRRCEIRFDWATDPPRLLVRGQDLTDRLRDDDVTSLVSAVARIPAVREVLVREQQRMGREHPRLVTEGRDQGSVVFPDAAAKFFLEASPQVRAQRRADQMRAAGRRVDVEKIREQIMARDAADSTRAVAPLVCPEGAERIDTSDLDLDEVLDLLESRVHARVAASA